MDYSLKVKTATEIRNTVNEKTAEKTRNCFKIKQSDNFLIKGAETSKLRSRSFSH